MKIRKVKSFPEEAELVDNKNSIGIHILWLSTLHTIFYCMVTSYRGETNRKPPTLSPRTQINTNIFLPLALIHLRHNNEQVKHFVKNYDS